MTTTSSRTTSRFSRECSSSSMSASSQEVRNASFAARVGNVGNAQASRCSVASVWRCRACSSSSRSARSGPERQVVSKQRQEHLLLERQVDLEGGADVADRRGDRVGEGGRPSSAASATALARSSSARRCSCCDRMLCRAVPASTRLAGADQPRLIAAPPLPLIVEDVMRPNGANPVPTSSLRGPAFQTRKDVAAGGGGRTDCALTDAAAHPSICRRATIVNERLTRSATVTVPPANENGAILKSRCRS